MSNCDKCGRDVHPTNDVICFELLKGNSRVLGATSRHLLPHKEEGVVVCPGSPSRAQYLEGQPRDPRPEYPYVLEAEEEERAAYAQLLAKYSPTPGTSTH